MNKTLFLLDLEDRYFLSHRRALGLAARAAGYRVVVCARIGGKYLERIRADGFESFALSENKKGIHPLHELRALIKLVRAYRAYHPHIAHHIGLRNLLHGSIAAWFAKTPAIVNSVVGLGALFTSGSMKLILLRKILLFALKRFLTRKNTWVIVQNDDDKRVILKNLLSEASRLTIIRGSGVDVHSFRPVPESPGMPMAVLVSRMLAHKGVREFVEAARLLREENVEVRMVLVGAPDPKNPSSIPESALSHWNERGEVEWWGYREDIREVWRGAHIAILPSYGGEGLPKSLLEAAAFGRPLVATDVPGCRDFVREGVNGFLIPTRDSRKLAQAIKKLAQAPDLRRRMGEAGRKMVEEKFSDEIVSQSILELYARCRNETGKK